MRRRQQRSERLLQRVPVPLIEYPLEVLIAGWGIAAGLSGLAQLTSSSTVSHLLPPVFVGLWKLSLALSGLSIAIGLLRHRYGTAVARGLSLFGTACVVYGVAIVHANPSGGAYAGSLLFLVAALCWLRAWYLRVRRRISRRIEAARAVTEAKSLERERQRTTQEPRQ